MVLSVWSDFKSPLHPSNIARSLDVRLTDGIRGDAILMVGSSRRARNLCEIAKEKGVKTILYWMGEDVYKTLNDSSWQAPEPDFHLTVHERLSSDLKKIGIRAKELKFFSPLKLQTVSIKNTKNVSVYFPKDHPKFMRDDLLKIIEGCPSKKFIIYGQDQDYLWPANVKSVKKITMEAAAKILIDSCFHLRWTRHDGFPQTIIKAKMLGRQVVTNYRYEGCIYAETVDDAIRELNDKNNQRVDSSHWPQWYRDNCSRENFKKSFFELTKGIL